jgi:hypothetical protein
VRIAGYIAFDVPFHKILPHERLKQINGTESSPKV